MTMPTRVRPWSSRQPDVGPLVETGHRPGALEIGLSRARLELTAFFREWDTVIFTFLFPIMLLVLFASASEAEVEPGVPFSQYFVGGMAASGLLLVSFQYLAITISLERDDGTLKRLAGTPMPRTSYFIGKAGVVLVAGVAQTVLLLTTGVVFYDLSLPTDAGRWWTFTWVALLGICAGTLLGIAYSSVPRSGRSASAVVMPVVLVLQFISGVFFVFSEIPGRLQQLGALFPLKWLAQGMRSVFLPDSLAADEVGGSWGHGATALVLVAWTLVGLALSLRMFRWYRRDER